MLPVALPIATASGDAACLFLSVGNGKDRESSRGIAEGKCNATGPLFIERSSAGVPATRRVPDNELELASLAASIKRR